LAAVIAGLTMLDDAALKAQWRTLYGSAPPRRITRGLLIGAVAYRLQERVLGGLTPSTRRLLTSAAEEQPNETPVRHAPQPDTILLREWHGVNYQVTVLEGGLEYRGQRYRSLSEVAASSPAALVGAIVFRPQATGVGMSGMIGQQRRCAIYTRKSSDEVLAQDFNSLQAQREACAAFIQSQQGEGWRLIETAYDDGGFSSGGMERPALSGCSPISVMA
jgi:site-specific DNA recombinase